jgi:hypothetical protein
VSPGLELALRLTLLTLALDPPLLWFERMPVLLLAGLGLALPAALRAPALWLALVAIACGFLAWNFPFPDNHDYLTALWCLAIACALASRAPAEMLAHHGRRLLGLTFLFATLWKLVLSPDFVDGRFFRLTLLTDARFENLAVLAGGMSWDAWERNDLAVDALLRSEPGEEAPQLVEPPELRRLASALTIFTGAVEALLAAAFLWPLGRGLSRWRDPLLLGFAAATFSFATVRGFGWLLMCLGVAQCSPSARRARAAYLAVFGLIALYRAVPWSRALIEWLDPTL